MQKINFILKVHERERERERERQTFKYESNLRVWGSSLFSPAVIIRDGVRLYRERIGDIIYR